MKKGLNLVAATGLVVANFLMPGAVVFAADEVDCADVSVVAQVGETCYANLQSAVNAGGTVELKKNYEIDDLAVNTATTLDLGGNTLKITQNYVDVNASLVVKNGTIEGAILTPTNVNPSDNTTIWVNDGGELTVEEDATITGETGISNWPNRDGTSNAKITVNGTVNATNAGVNILGTTKSTTTYPTVKIGNTAKIIAAREGEDVTAIYLAGYNDTTIENGAVVTGSSTAVEVRAGKLTINGGSFTATSTADPTVATANGSGSTTNGAAIAIAQHTTKLPINVTINGGSFTGTSAFFESNPQNNDAAGISQISVAIRGGTFNGKVSAVDAEDYMTGGVITVEPLAEEIDDGYDAFKKADGTYVVLPVPTTGTYNKTLEYGDSYTMEGLAPGFEEFYEENTTDTNVAYVVLPVITGVDLGDSTTTMTLHGVKSDYVNTYNISVVENPVEETTTVVATQEGSADAPNTGVATSSDSSVKSNNALMAAMAAGVTTMAGAFVVLKKRTRK